MRRGFSLLEVMIATIILSFGLSAALLAMSLAQKTMLGGVRYETAQEVMDMGEMAYPLDDIRDPSRDLDVSEKKVSELWSMISDERMTSAQEEKFKGYYWRREWINKHDDKEIARLGGLHVLRVTVTWGDRFRGRPETDGYVTFWRKPE